MPQGKKPTTKSGKQAKVHRVMGEFKRGQLRSGSKHGPQVKNRKQAIAIAMSESGQSKGKRARKKK
jgi:hypothetical protein